MQWAAMFDPRGGVDRPEYAYGPFDEEAEARAFARTLSTDPDEGVAFRLIDPDAHRNNLRAQNLHDILARETKD